MRLLLYYLSILLPFPLFYLLLTKGEVSPFYFFLGLFVYIFIYRPLLDGKRLIELGKLSEENYSKVFNPIVMARLRYTNFMSLYFK